MSAPSVLSVAVVVGVLVLAVLGTLLLRMMSRPRPRAVAHASAEAPTGLRLPVATTNFGGYQVVDLIGETQSALLYQGRTPDGRPCTIKLPDRSCLADPDEVRRFMREEQLLDSIHHPNVLRKIAAGTVEDRGRKIPYLVIEPLPGKLFTDFLAERAPLPPVEAVALLLQLASILDAIHGKGVIHRNLSPEAICITPEQRVVVYNFGVARGVSMDTITMHGQIVGSVEYIAPEQLFGRPTDGRSDLYALGVLGYRLVTGRSPFVYTSMASLVKQKNENEGPHPRKDNPQVPLELDAILSSLLSRDPGRRPGAAAVLHQALQGIGA